MAGICTTAYEADAVPDVTVRMVMEKHMVAPAMRILIANTGFLTSALFAAAGADASVPAEP